jgi:hypothetical protein
VALLWTLIAWSDWDMAATEVAGTPGVGAAVGSVRFVGVGSAATVVAGITVHSAALAYVRLVGEASASLCGDGLDN